MQKFSKEFNKGVWVTPIPKSCNSIRTRNFIVTHWNLNKIANISQTYWNAFSWMKLIYFASIFQWSLFLTHWGLVTHICVNKLTIIGSDNGLAPARRQAIIWTNDGILLVGPLGTNFSEILIKIHTFSFKTVYLKMSFGKRWPVCLGLNVLMV